jgi:glycosyltransferase involved in cell wall biosynthesis
LKKSNIKVCHISTLHPANSVRIFDKECKSILASGYSVSYIAQNDIDRIVEGIKITALSKPITRKDRMVRHSYQAYRKAIELDADVYHFHDPELIPIGILLKIVAKKKVIYDVHEDLPVQVLNKKWINPCFRKSISVMIDKLEMISARYFDAIVAATPLIQSRFPKDKVFLVQNYPIIKEFISAGDDDYLQRKPVVSYIGGISVPRGAREMVKAVSRLPDVLNAELHMAGNVQPESLVDELKAYPGKIRLTMHGWISRKEVSKLLSATKVGLVVLHPLENYLDSYPVKLFEYMAAAIPVVASDFPLWKTIIENAGCGLVVDPQDPDKISEAICWLLEHPVEAEQMGKRGEKAVQNIYNWDREAEKLLSMYERILNA